MFFLPGISAAILSSVAVLLRTIVITTFWGVSDNWRINSNYRIVVSLNKVDYSTIAYANSTGTTSNEVWRHASYADAETVPTEMFYCNEWSECKSVLKMFTFRLVPEVFIYFKAIRFWFQIMFQLICGGFIRGFTKECQSIRSPCPSKRCITLGFCLLNASKVSWLSILSLVSFAVLELCQGGVKEQQSDESWVPKRVLQTGFYDILLWA